MNSIDKSGRSGYEAQKHFYVSDVQEYWQAIINLLLDLIIRWSASDMVFNPITSRKLDRRKDLCGAGSYGSI